MTYNKPHLPVPQQRALLESRGLLIADPAKAEEYLQRIGYYRLSAYWYPFRKIEKQADGSYKLGDHFKDGTDFGHVTALYAFDKTLRLLALDALERIEVSIRTEVALCLGSHDPTGHRDPKKLDKRFTTPGTGFQNSKHDGWLKQLDDRAASSKEEFANHFRSKYPNSHMPIWIAVELLDFGPLSHLLAGMRYADLQTISKSYGGLQPHLIKSWIRALCGVRNVCAHHSRLWNKPLVDQPALPRQGEVPEMDHLAHTPGGNRRIYAAFSVMQTLLKLVNPRTKWAERLKAHMATFPAAPNVTIADAGFPANWEQLPLWK
ncbi:Abortive infection bacteriophage resistance protein [Rhizobium tibeticum]|uniref:Abortive infection bacteriophage resistance protein n=1 Tax=Rhizobium tibeticum TaxID=501024 RepID=A0A1H8JU89_9HYPH|nr:Abi family protein [Rhizobium tibeticum]SEH79362.1 Abortive infection bacteriophage resistance protein [Rhizobium tibeticum]SEN84269.1 Abortive infection bacteriophage resistance protein [Rhizobium tibeticum]